MGSMGLLAGARGAGARVVAARVVLARYRASHSATSTVAASRHASSFPPPPLTGTPSSLPADYYLPFGNSSLLIPTLPKHEHMSSTPSPSSAAQQSASALAASTSHEPSLRPPTKIFASQPQTPPSTFTSASSSSQKIAEATPPPRRESSGLQKESWGQSSPTGHSPGRQLRKKVEDPRFPSSLSVNEEKVENPRFPSSISLSEEPQHIDHIQHDVAKRAADTYAAFTEYAEPKTETRPAVTDPIHILGGNPQAVYLAHMLAALPNSPAVRLIHTGFHQARQWDEEGERVKVVRRSQVLPRKPVVGEYIGKAPDAMPFVGRKGSSMNKTGNRPRSFDVDQRPIENLIVTMSCSSSIQAIQMLQHRIDHRTTICLVQPGLGVVERLNKLCFPDIPSRPSYILGQMTHDLGYGNDPFTVSEIVPGKLALTRYTPLDQLAENESLFTEYGRAVATSDVGGDVDGDGDGAPPPFVPALPPAQEGGNEYNNGAQGRGLEHNNGMRLMYLLGVTPELGAGGYSTAEFLRHKLPDMVYTAAVEPVATVLDLPLGDPLWLNGHARIVINELVQEMVNVILKLPETLASSRLRNYVSSGSLQRKIFHSSFRQNDGRFGHAGHRASQFEDGDVYNSVQQSAGSSGHCRMAQRVAAGHRTDIEFLNGYFVRRGQEVGVDCPMNKMIVRMVRAKLRANQSRPYKQTLPGTPGNMADIPFAEAHSTYGASTSQPTPRPRVPAAGKFQKLPRRRIIPG